MALDSFPLAMFALSISCLTRRDAGTQELCQRLRGNVAVDYTVPSRRGIYHG